MNATETKLQSLYDRAFNCARYSEGEGQTWEDEAIDRLFAETLDDLAYEEIEAPTLSDTIYDGFQLGLCAR